MQEDKKNLALRLFNEFYHNPFVINQGKKQTVEEFDKTRLEALTKINAVLRNFFQGIIGLEEFKRKIDSLNKQNPYWGFRGINGQMFFNMLYNSSDDKKLLRETLLDTLKIPQNIQDSKSKINKIIEFVKLSSSETDKRKIPRIKSVLFFISYFWQIQEPDRWPVFYNSLEQTFIELGYLEKIVNLSDYYEEFYNLNSDLLKIFLEKNNKANLWFIEHVFWKYFIQKQEIAGPYETTKEKKKIKEKPDFISNYIPPIISNILELSLNESNPADFEKKILILFQMLGFETELKGQGKGRMVDIIAKANMGKPYILLIDCKARSQKDFRLNAGEERTVVEYIKNFAYNYPRESKYETHYLIVSSGFRNDGEDIRRKIKGETGTDVSFISVQNLLFLFVNKLQNWDLDLDRMKEIFQREGLITKDVIQDIIGR